MCLKRNIAKSIKYDGYKTDLAKWGEVLTSINLA